MWGGCGGEVHDLRLQLDFLSSEHWWLLALLQKLIGGLKGTQPAEMSPATSSSLTFLAVLHFPYFSFPSPPLSFLSPFFFLFSSMPFSCPTSCHLAWGFPFWILSCRFGCDPKAYTTKTNWPQSAYPSCRQAEETLVRLCNIRQLAHVTLPMFLQLVCKCSSCQLYGMIWAHNHCHLSLSAVRVTTGWLII